MGTVPIADQFAIGTCGGGYRRCVYHARADGGVRARRSAGDPHDSRRGEH
eukprot:COSAG02_NODE_1773_length_10980_cov_8.196765_1_plen_50_part_00